MPLIILGPGGKRVEIEKCEEWRDMVCLEIEVYRRVFLDKIIGTVIPEIIGAPHCGSEIAYWIGGPNYVALEREGYCMGGRLVAYIEFYEATLKEENGKTWWCLDPQETTIALLNMEDDRAKKTQEKIRKIIEATLRKHGVKKKVRI